MEKIDLRNAMQEVYLLMEKIDLECMARCLFVNGVDRLGVHGKMFIC